MMQLIYNSNTNQVTIKLILLTIIKDSVVDIALKSLDEKFYFPIKFPSNNELTTKTRMEDFQFLKEIVDKFEHLRGCLGR